MRSVHWLMLGLLTGVGLAPAAGQANEQEMPATDSEPDARANMFRNVGKLLKSFQSLGSWDQHYGYMMDSVERVYQKQGWNSESDQFSLDLVRTVESVPPWAVQERFDTMVGLFSDRYMLDEQQEQTLRGVMARTSNEVFQTHSDRIIKYAVEAVQTRAAGEAFTPEQVQRWVELAEPVFQEMRGRLNKNADVLSQQLDPQQRELLQRDLAAGNQRMNRLEEMGQRWKRGEWSSADWGMENDPIQAAAEGRRAAEVAAEQQRAADGVEGPVSAQPIDADGSMPQPPDPGEAATENEVAPPPAPEPAQPHRAQPRPSAPANAANDPWAGYVQAFISKFKLTGEQSERAWQIFGDVRGRRDELQSRADKKRGALSDMAQPDALKTFDSQNQATLARLFDQMARRMDRLPTRSQRKEAGPEALPANPVAPAPAAPVKPVVTVQPRKS